MRDEVLLYDFFRAGRPLCCIKTPKLPMQFLWLAHTADKHGKDAEAAKRRILGLCFNIFLFAFIYNVDTEDLCDFFGM